MIKLNGATPGFTVIVILPFTVQPPTVLVAVTKKVVVAATGTVGFADVFPGLYAAAGVHKYVTPGIALTPSCAIPDPHSEMLLPATLEGKL